VAGFDRIAAITVQSESGGNPNAVSPKGARGLMQVMPGTARDPGFGIRPSAGNPQDDVRVGREYLAKMQQRYGNDPAKMWAAYNAGPGRLDDALKRGGTNWLSLMPAETQNYVRKNMRALGSR
jgi:soluble lytic murein transglycosylase